MIQQIVSSTPLAVGANMNRQWRENELDGVTEVLDIPIFALLGIPSHRRSAGVGLLR